MFCPQSGATKVLIHFHDLFTFEQHVDFVKVNKNMPPHSLPIYTVFSEINENEMTFGTAQTQNTFGPLQVKPVHGSILNL